MAFIPSRHSLDFYTPGTPTVDEFGDEVPGVGRWESTPVASWWIDRVDESAGDSIMRRIDELHIHVEPQYAPTPGGKVRTPDSKEWQVQGNAENYDHGWHGWAPGLVVVHARRVEG